LSKVFIYWDNSNIFVGARHVAAERDGVFARSQVRVHFENMFKLAHADREVAKALAVGSAPPEIRHLWNRLEGQGLKVELYDRGEISRGEQNAPDITLQLRMLEDGLDNNGNPGTIVLLTGNGSGYSEGARFQGTLERLHKRDWKVEILSWTNACNQRMREWAEANGIFVALDDYYDAVTFVEPTVILGGSELYPGREAKPLDLTKRARA